MKAKQIVLAFAIVSLLLFALAALSSDKVRSWLGRNPPALAERPDSRQNLQSAEQKPNGEMNTSSSSATLQTSFTVTPIIPSQVIPSEQITKMLAPRTTIPSTGKTAGQIPERSTFTETVNPNVFSIRVDMIYSAITAEATAEPALKRTDAQNTNPQPEIPPTVGPTVNIPTLIIPTDFLGGMNYFPAGTGLPSPPTSTPVPSAGDLAKQPQGQSNQATKTAAPPSGNVFFYGGCLPDRVRISVKISSPDVYSTVLFLRLADKATGEMTDWDTGTAMNPSQSGGFTLTVKSTNIHEFNKYKETYLVYQFVTTNLKGELLSRSKRMNDITLKACS